jgi:hypothetical protein
MQAAVLLQMRMMPNKALQATAAALSVCGRFMIIHCHFSFPRPAQRLCLSSGR